MLEAFFKNKFRVVKDNCLSYEVQVKRWWLPFWTQVGFTNSFETVEEAEWWAKYRTFENWKF